MMRHGTKTIDNIFSVKYSKPEFPPVQLDVCLCGQCRRDSRFCSSKHYGNNNRKLLVSAFKTNARIYNHSAWKNIGMVVKDGWTYCHAGGFPKHLHYVTNLKKSAAVFQMIRHSSFSTFIVKYWREALIFLSSNRSTLTATLLAASRMQLGRREVPT